MNTIIIIISLHDHDESMHTVQSSYKSTQQILFSHKETIYSSQREKGIDMTTSLSKALIQTANSKRQNDNITMQPISVTHVQRLWTGLRRSVGVQTYIKVACFTGWKAPNVFHDCSVINRTHILTFVNNLIKTAKKKTTNPIGEGNSILITKHTHQW